MATTIQQSINAVQSALGFWVPAVGTNSEPAITAANMTQQIMLSPPFHFPWNRTQFTFQTIVGGQDYIEPILDFGFIEIATAAATNSLHTYPLKIQNITPIGESNDKQQPLTMGIQQNIPGTSVWFRFLGAPNGTYNVVVWYQKFLPLMTTLTGATGTWAAPDYMQYVYNRGFLAHLYEAKGDARAQQEKVAFAAALLATHEGLTDTEINLFLAQYLVNPRTTEGLQLKTQQGVQARGQ